MVAVFQGYWGLSYFPSAKVELLKGKKILNASTTNPEEIVKIAREVEEAGGSLTEMSIMIGAEELLERKGQFLLGCRLMKKYSGKKFFLHKLFL